MIRKLVTVLIFALSFAQAGAHAASSSTQLQRLLLPLQRFGSCSDLPKLGVSVHPKTNPADAIVRLTLELGAKLVRFDVAWAEVERDGKYDFSGYDELVQALRKQGKEMVLILDYGHPAHSDGESNGMALPPRTDEQRDAFYKYVQAVVSRYRGPEFAYEIWNEPNLPVFWRPAPDAASFATLLTGAAKAIRAIDPSALIISAGLANEAGVFDFQRVLAAKGALEQVSASAFHPYRKDAPEGSLADIAQFSLSSTTNKVAAPPLWLTEWGYTETWYADRNQQAARALVANMTARLLLTATLAKSKAVVVYDLIDDGADRNDPEANFGLYDHQLKPKQSARAFHAIAELMTGCSTYEFKVDKTQKLIVASFRFDGARSYLVWRYRTGDRRSACFALPEGEATSVHDLSGSSLPIETCGAPGKIRLGLSGDLESPVLLIKSAMPK